MNAPTDEEWDAMTPDEREAYLAEQDAEAEALARAAWPEDFES